MQCFSCYKLFSINSSGYVGVILQGDIFLNKYGNFWKE